MTTKLAIFCAVMLAAFSLVFALPKQLGYQPVGIVLKLPDSIGYWLGKDAAVTKLERETLGEDTQFERKNYFNGTGDHVYASIVLAGQDMMTGIHRPERCLSAQGWTADSPSELTLDLPDFGPIELTRLHTSKKVDVNQGTGRPPQFVTVQSVSYYYFIGYTEVVASHERRVAIDFRDRVLRGYNQRWAMVMFTSEITAGYRRFGRDEKQTDELMTGFIKQVTPQLLGESVRRHVAKGGPATTGMVAASR
jgi:hypothetical protein